MATCWYCEGKGSTGPVHVNRGELGGEWIETMSCRECGGTGQWTDDRAARFYEGQKIRALRIARGESIGEAAKRMGISPSGVSAIERGRPL
jgi:DnaJ-class molecular chaperone